MDLYQCAMGFCYKISYAAQDKKPSSLFAEVPRKLLLNNLPCNAEQVKTEGETSAQPTEDK